jgi:UDP-N-acetylglucosamine:LPS N-acetylglucosamine transferase
VSSTSERPAQGSRPLRVCVIGLGGGGFHWEAQKIVQAVRRPLELVLVYAGPKGGLIYWESKDAIRSRYMVRSPSLTGDGPLARIWILVSNLWHAWRILRKEKPDLVLAAGTAQAVPFAVAARLTGTRLWFVESITRALHPCRTSLLMHRLGLGSRLYYYWSELSAQLPKAICMESRK